MIAISVSLEPKFYTALTALQTCWTNIANVLEKQMADLNTAVNDLTTSVQKISDSVSAETNAITNMAQTAADGANELKALVAQLTSAGGGSGQPIDPAALEALATQINTQADAIVNQTAQIQQTATNLSTATSDAASNAAALNPTPAP